MDPAAESIDPFELEAIERRADASDVKRLVHECRRLRRALADRRSTEAAVPVSSGRAEAAELDLERAHRLLDELDVPRAEHVEGERDPAELSLLGRLQIALGDD
jgi:hypothetical protein